MKLPWEILGRAGASGWAGLLLELFQGAADGMYLEETVLDGVMSRLEFGGVTEGADGADITFVPEVVRPNDVVEMEGFFENDKVEGRAVGPEVGGLCLG